MFFCLLRIVVSIRFSVSILFVITGYLVSFFLRDYVSCHPVHLCSYWNLIHFSQFPVCLLAYSLCTLNFSLRFLGWRASMRRHLLPTLIHRQVYLSALPYLLYAWAWWASRCPYCWLYRSFCCLEHASFISYLLVQSHQGFPSTS